MKPAPAISGGSHNAATVEALDDLLRERRGLVRCCLASTMATFVW